jgi:hypothetical protein
MLKRIAEISRKLDICGLHRCADQLFKYAEELAMEKYPDADIDVVHGLSEVNDAEIYTHPESKYSQGHPDYPRSQFYTEAYPEQDVYARYGISLFILPDGTIIDLRYMHHGEAVNDFKEYVREKYPHKTTVTDVPNRGDYHYMHLLTGAIRVYFERDYDESGTSKHYEMFVRAYGVLTPEALQSLARTMDACNVSQINTFEYTIYNNHHELIYSQAHKGLSISELSRLNSRLEKALVSKANSYDIDDELRNIDYFENFKKFIHKRDIDDMEKVVTRRPMPSKEKTDWSKILRHMRDRQLPIEKTIKQESLRGASKNK